MGTKVRRLSLRCIIALLFGTALLGAADTQFPAAAFYWDATHVAIVLGEASDQVPQNATKMPERDARPPFGDCFALPEVSNSNGVTAGESFDINLTGNFWARATVNSIAYNKTEYSGWMLGIATIDRDHDDRYAAAIHAKLHVFLAERAEPRRASNTGQVRSPFMKVDLPSGQRAALEANLNDIMATKLHQAMVKQRNDADNELLSQLVSVKAKLVVDIDQFDLGPEMGVRQHVLGKWNIGEDTVLSIQGWKRLDSNQLDFLEAVDGVSEDKAEILGAIGDWGEEGRDDFTIENVLAGSQLIRHSAGYESSTIYLERMTNAGRDFARSLYGA